MLKATAARKTQDETHPGQRFRIIHLFADSMSSSPDIASDSPPSQGRSRAIGAAVLGLLLALSVGLRFHHLEYDLPYGIVSESHTFVTDEGWYNKNALLLVRFGEWSNPGDLNHYTHTILYTVLMRGVLEVFGTSLWTVRAVSVVAFVISLMAFYGLSRTVLPRRLALLAALAVSATMSVVTFSRMAIIEPVAVAPSLVALWLWVRRPQHPGWALASLLLAAAAVFLKVSFAFTLGTVAVLVLGDAAWLARQGRRRQAIALAALTAAVLAATALGLKGVWSWAERDAEVFHHQTAMVHVGRTSLSQILIKEARAVRHRSLDPDKVVPVATMAILLPILLLRRGRRGDLARVFGQRATLAMLVWGASGFLQFSAIHIRFPRYYYFLTFPLLILAVQTLGAVARRRWLQISAVVLGLHLVVQLSPQIHPWLARDADDSYARLARDVAAQVEAGATGPVRLIGPGAPFVALFGNSIRPLNPLFRYRPEAYCANLELWRPPFILDYPQAVADIEETCSGSFASLEPLERYRFMEHWERTSEMLLARFVYDASPGKPVAKRNAGR